MDQTFIQLSPDDRALIAELAYQLKRRNDLDEANRGDELLTCSQAAECLGVTRQTVSLMLRQKRLHKAVRGGRAGILRSELERVSV